MFSEPRIVQYDTIGGAGRCLAMALLAGVALLAGACGDSRTANAQRKIREEHGPALVKTVLEDLARHRKGLRKAAGRLAPGFVKVSGAQQEKDMRWAVRKIHEPPKGIPELVVSPMSFMAAVNGDGVVVARDTKRAEDDHMMGMKLADRFPSVRRALEGEAGYEVGSFESLFKGGKPSVSIVMAAPCRYEGRVVGALVLGIPLWRLQQRLSRQLQLDHASVDGLILWVYVYKGPELFHHGTPPNLDTVVPDAQTREAGYKRSHGGFTGELQQFGRWYGWGVSPLRVLGPDVGMIIVRSDPL
ncbi:MAG: cache domain-containing protein [Proteobacteria bacterium]|nr:cache domain-containing protein [Pseudomonadota bacterium]